MPTGTTCTVWVDGERLADGAPTDDPYAPNALAGLKVSWGRDTTVDQPEASTCTFDVLDQLGGTSFVGVLHTGADVRVTAENTVYPDPTVPTWADPGFEDGLPDSTTTNARVTLSDVAATGAHSLRVEPVKSHQRASVVVPPAPFVPAGTDPGSWDDIPTTDYGQTWTYGATLRVPPGARALVRPVLFSGPYAGASAVSTLDALAVDGDGSWQTVAGAFTPWADGQWVGLQVSTYPTGWQWDQVPPALTWDQLAVDWSSWAWDDLGAVLVDDVVILAPDAGTTTTVLVYAGRIVSLIDAWDEDTGAPVISVSCVDFTADLDNIDVGDTPWEVEPMGDRFARILDVSGMAVTADIDASAAAPLVSWRDVDKQPAAGLLAELAESVDAVMWSATHQVTGPYLQVADPANRPAQSVLSDVDGVVSIVGGSTGGVVLSACDVLRDDVEWLQDTQDVATRADVGWLVQTVDDDGLPTTTDATVSLVDDALEAELGVRRLSLSTQLQSEADAADVAARLLARMSATSWRASGLVVDDLVLPDTAEDVALVGTLLDGTTRNGLGLLLVDLPSWAPVAGTVGAYLEGGTYTFDNGAWILELNVSNSEALGESAAWDHLHPDWSWDEFDPSITWDDLRGVGVAPDEGAM